MSEFFVVSVATGAREDTYKSYKTLRGAEKFAERLNAKNPGYFKQVAVSAEYYADVLSKRKTTVTNLMSGKEVEIRKVDLGTCVDPSTERYFSF